MILDAESFKKELAEACRWPVFDEEDKKAVLAAMDDPPHYEESARLEEEFARYFGVKYALAHNNGTSSIHAAYFAAGVKPGDEVIVPAYTWHLGVSQLITLHAVPVFCDIDPKTLTILPEDIERKISPKTRAICILHSFGIPAPMDEIMSIAQKHGIPVIEDCAHAHGAKYKGKKVGTIGDIGCFSFQASKLMPAIEGGILITNNQEYYERAVTLGHYEKIPSLQLPQYQKYMPAYPNAPACFGYKYRIHPWAAAVARVKLRNLDAQNAIRTQNMKYISEAILACDDILDFQKELPQTERVWFNCICICKEGTTAEKRDKLISLLCDNGLGANAGRAGYVPLYWNPLYQELAANHPFGCSKIKPELDYSQCSCPNAENIVSRTIGLPLIHHKCRQELLDTYIEIVKKSMESL